MAATVKIFLKVKFSDVKLKEGEGIRTYGQPY
jgi:hypothetical protein